MPKDVKSACVCVCERAREGVSVSVSMFVSVCVCVGRSDGLSFPNGWRFRGVHSPCTTACFPPASSQNFDAMARMQEKHVPRVGVEALS